MLCSLSISDVVLIERLDLSFEQGLCVLTGETGAGKSILLDALGLALGARADSGLVRRGADRAVVSVVFDLKDDHPAWGVLAESGIEKDGGELILRRVLGADGRSRAFINDNSISIGLLSRLAETLVEVHGQFENQRLLDPASHQGFLDAFAGLFSLVGSVKKSWDAWNAAKDLRQQAEAEMEKTRQDESFLRHALEELEVLDPHPGEEEALAKKRNVLMHSEKLIEALGRASSEMGEGRSVESSLRSAIHHLERVAEKAEGRLDDVIATLDRAACEVAEGETLLERLADTFDLDPRALDNLEERLFTLRRLAGKHKVPVDALSSLSDEFAQKIASIEDGGDALKALKAKEEKARAAFLIEAEKLTKVRQAAAKTLDLAMTKELEPLKLGKAIFSTSVESLEEKNWGPQGCEKVVFEVATNIGSASGPLRKIASGGELSRFMLALKVVLAGVEQIPTLVFDEVDSGVGGAVAAAVGSRLAKLAEDVQVLVVTHSPQVAAMADHHWQVMKSDNNQAVFTTVEILGDNDKAEEIARMLSGENVTSQARAAALRLMEDRQR
jgi:DNA repair protein RecN (Recombination protein N)